MVIVKTLLREELILNEKKRLLSEESLRLINDWEHVNHILGINTSLNEHLDLSIRKRIIEEQLLFEDMLSSIKSYVKDKYDKTVEVVKSIPDIMVLLKDMVQSRNTMIVSNSLMGTNLETGLQKFTTTIEVIVDKIKGKAAKVADKILGVLKKVTDIIKKLLSQDGWRGFLLKAGLLLLINYISIKLIKPIENSIETLTSGFATSLISSLDFFNGLRDMMKNLSSIKPLVGWLTGIGLSIAMISDVFTPVATKVNKWNKMIARDTPKKIRKKKV